MSPTTITCDRFAACSIRCRRAWLAMIALMISLSPVVAQPPAETLAIRIRPLLAGFDSLAALCRQPPQWIGVSSSETQLRFDGYRYLIFQSMTALYFVAGQIYTASVEQRTETGMYLDRMAGFLDYWRSWFASKGSGSREITFAEIQAPGPPPPPVVPPERFDWHASLDASGFVYSLFPANSSPHLGYAVIPDLRVSYTMSKDDRVRAYASFRWTGISRLAGATSIGDSTITVIEPAAYQQAALMAGFSFLVHTDQRQSIISTAVARVSLGVGWGNFLFKPDQFIQGWVLAVGIEANLVSFNW